jgi:hypothetical protein
MILKISSPNNLTSLNQIIHSYVFKLRKVIVAVSSKKNVNLFAEQWQKIAQNSDHNIDPGSWII